MVRELLDELKRTSPERTCVFHITDGIMVNADQKLLRVALNNLLRNAWKYTGKREEAHIQRIILCPRKRVKTNSKGAHVF